MKTSQFDYNLDESLIAFDPPAMRGSSRLLVVDRASGRLQHRRYPDVVEYVKPGDVVVINNTSVIKARLFTTNSRNHKKVECLLLKQLEEGYWECILGRAKNIEIGDRLLTEAGGGYLEVISHSRKEQIIFTIKIHTDLSFETFLDRYGHVPLPPYIKREDTLSDVERYNTVFSKKPGSVAAPTASLNLTVDTINALKAKGAQIVEVTLHVSWGTFAPVRTENIEDFQIHTEYISLSEQAAERINHAVQSGGSVLAFGTTATRTLESCADPEKPGLVNAYTGETDIFIYPGYKWKVVNKLVTNFHAPKSSLIMLVASFAGYDLTMKAYNEAMREKYRFLSYGDSMLII